MLPINDQVLNVPLFDYLMTAPCDHTMTAPCGFCRCCWRWCRVWEL